MMMSKEMSVFAPLTCNLLLSWRYVVLHHVIYESMFTNRHHHYMSFSKSLGEKREEEIFPVKNLERESSLF